MLLKVLAATGAFSGSASLEAGGFAWAAFLACASAIAFSLAPASGS